MIRQEQSAKIIGAQDELNTDCYAQTEDDSQHPQSKPKILRYNFTEADGINNAPAAGGRARCSSVILEDFSNGDEPETRVDNYKPSLNRSH